MSAPLRVALVAGEQSGDRLGAALITSLAQQAPGSAFRGLAGPLMRGAGCQALGDAEELAVMGLIEPLRHLPRLLRLRRHLLQELLAWKPDVFIGIDAPAFNLGLAAAFKSHGVRTVQYVSPQIWAWRQGRVRKIARRCDLVLCLLPFEPQFYRGHAVCAEFVGHPLADEIALPVDQAAARAQLGIAPSARVIALLPGSRRSEVHYMGPPMIATAQLLRQRFPDLQFVVPLANDTVRGVFESQLPAGADWLQRLSGQARAVFTAADVALVTSGTATLEGLLCRCPMVVAYKANPWTAAIVRGLRLVKLAHFSLPNLLADETLVPEFLQEAVVPEALAQAVAGLLSDTLRAAYLRQRFDVIHETLRAGGSERAARAVLELVAGGTVGTA